MVQHVLRAIWQCGSTFVLFIPLAILGLPMIAIGLCFPRATSPEVKFTQYATEDSWQRIQLPDWKVFRYWDHLVDGFRGDTRGWWHTNAVFKGGSQAFWNMWWWGAIRNPVDNWRRFIIGCPIDECEITKLAGNADEVHTNNHAIVVGNGVFAWNFLVAEHKTLNRRWYQFSFILPWTLVQYDAQGRVLKKGRCLNFWIGWRFKLQHQDEVFTGSEHYKRWKGFEFLIHPWKYYD